jgi:hypothetical protein
MRQLGQVLIGCAFRGHQDSSWGLITSLHRVAEQFRHPSKYLASREGWMLTQFQRRAHHYISDPPSRDNKLEWLALIQHYGGPTRLLDFSHSFYVATFFAVERAFGDAAVWAIRIRAIEEFVKSKQNVDPEQAKTETIYNRNQRHVTLAEAFVGVDETEKMVLSVEPDRMNERLSIQQGLFMFPCDITGSFEENLATTFEYDSSVFQNQLEIPYSFGQHNYQTLKQFNVIKIIIPRNLHRNIILDLAQMNVTSTTLFPGLDGFARSLYYHLRALDMNF